MFGFIKMQLNKKRFTNLIEIERKENLYKFELKLGIKKCDTLDEPLIFLCDKIDNIRLLSGLFLKLE